MIPSAPCVFHVTASIALLGCVSSLPSFLSSLCLTVVLWSVVSCLLFWGGLGQLSVLSPSQTGEKIIRYVIEQTPLSRFSLFWRVCSILAGAHPGVREPLFSGIPTKGAWHVLQGPCSALGSPPSPVVLPSTLLLILGETISPFS